MVHHRKESAALAAAAAVLALGACTSGGGNGATTTGRSGATTHPPTGGSGPRTTAPSPAHSAPTRTHPIVLRCTDGQTGLNVPTAARAHVGGLVSSFLAGSPGTFSSSYPRLAIGEDDYVAIKSVLYATAQAGRHSTVTLISPASARMFYTDWSHWAGVQDVPSTARSVSVAACSGQTVGYPGFLLVTGPTCLTYRITAAGNQKAESRTVPIGRQMC